MDKKLLGKRINTARKERGWTSERLSEACNINATYLRQIEAENIDFRRSAQPLLDPPYEAHAFGAVQLREQLDRLIRLAAELFARLLQRKVDVHMAVIVHPAVSHGQAHAVQHEAIQQLRVGGEPPKVRLGDQELGDAEKGVLLGVHAEMVRKDRLRHIWHLRSATDFIYLSTAVCGIVKGSIATQCSLTVTGSAGGFLFSLT